MSLWPAASTSLDHHRCHRRYRRCHRSFERSQDHPHLPKQFGEKTKAMVSQTSHGHKTAEIEVPVVQRGHHSLIPSQQYNIVRCSIIPWCQKSKSPCTSQVVSELRTSDSPTESIEEALAISRLFPVPGTPAEARATGSACSSSAENPDWAWREHIHMYIYIYIYTHTHSYIYIYMSARQHRHEMGCYSYSLRTSLGYWMRREFRLRAPERNTLPLRASSGITVLLYHCVLCCCAAVVLPRCWVVPCMQGVLRHAARLQGLFIYVYREREVCTHTTLYKIVTFMLYNIIMCTYIYIYIYIHIWGGNLEARPRRGHLGRRESNLLYYSII